MEIMPCYEPLSLFIYAYNHHNISPIPTQKVVLFNVGSRYRSSLGINIYLRTYIPDSKTWLAFACWLKSLGIRQRITLKYFVFPNIISKVQSYYLLPLYILVLMHVSTSMSNVCSCVANFVSFYWLFTFSHWNRVMSSHFVHANIVQMLLYYGCYWWISCKCIYIADIKQIIMMVVVVKWLLVWFGLVSHRRRLFTWASNPHHVNSENNNGAIWWIAIWSLTKSIFADVHAPHTALSSNSTCTRMKIERDQLRVFNEKNWKIHLIGIKRKTLIHDRSYYYYLYVYINEVAMSPSPSAGNAHQNAGTHTHEVVYNLDKQRNIVFFIWMEIFATNKLYPYPPSSATPATRHGWVACHTNHQRRYFDDDESFLFYSSNLGFT